MARRPVYRGNRPRPAGGAHRGAAIRGMAGPAASVATAPREIELPESITVRDLAEKLAIPAVDIIKALLKNGVAATINQSMTYETAAALAAEWGFEVSPEEHTDGAQTLRPGRITEADSAQLQARPPVVTVMGHVDHGKTSLLDAIRNTNVTAREAGGITQHIGAYQVEVDGQKITFLDTPGHEAFTAMRARGANVTDIAVIVVAADDGVMPQTIEAINHARAAGVPIIIAINKIDRPDANVERAKRQLAEQGVLIEEWGGDVICVEVSARTQQGIPDLLEHILLVAEIEELKANPDRPAEGVVVEAHLDPQRGPMAVMLVQAGTLNLGDIIVTEQTYGRIKAMYDDRNRQIRHAGPSTPLKALGLNTVPQPGDTFTVVRDERTARASIEERTRRREEQGEAARAISLTDVFARAQSGQVKELNVVLKADVQGSIEPIRSSLSKLGDENLRVHLLHAAAGSITESDVMLALASGGIILGFNTRPEPGAKRLADVEGVEIRTYDVIYKLVEDLEKALRGMLEPAMVEVIDGHAEVRQIFKVSRIGNIAGCAVTDGKAVRSSSVRVMRGGKVIAEDRVQSLKHFKDDVREMAAGFECGVILDSFDDFQQGDVLEFFHKEKES